MNHEITKRLEEQDATERAGGGAIAWRRLPGAALVAGAAAVAGNAVIFWAGTAAGAIPATVRLPSMMGVSPLTAGIVAMTTVQAMVLATLVFAAIGLLARRPVRSFRIVASVALVLSFAMPITVTGPTALMRLTLVGMHVVAWSAAVSILATFARRPPPVG